MVQHLSDIFTMDGIQRVSARDKILREIISNLLMHRDFSSVYVPKFLIERETIITENANLAHGHGNLNLKTFKSFAKNPPIAKVFREIGLADELGSGTRNSYKYTRMYSGGEPTFKEGDVFTIVIPLSEAATATVGSTTQDTPQGASQDTPQVIPNNLQERLIMLVDYCVIPRNKKKMMELLGLSDKKNFRNVYLLPLLDEGRIVMTIPDKPISRNQKYKKK